MKRLELLSQISALKVEKRTDAITPQRVGTILQEMATIAPEDSMPGSEELSTQLTQYLDQMEKLTRDYNLTVQDFQKHINEAQSQFDDLRTADNKPLVLPFDNGVDRGEIVPGSPTLLDSEIVYYYEGRDCFVVGDGTNWYKTFPGSENYNVDGRARRDALFRNGKGEMYAALSSKELTMVVPAPSQSSGSGTETDKELVLPFHGIAANSAAATTVGAIYYNSSAKAFYTKKSSASFELLQDERYNVNIGVLGATVHANPARFFSLELMTGACYLCFAKADGSLLRIDTTAV